MPLLLLKAQFHSKRDHTQRMLQQGVWFAVRPLDTELTSLISLMAKCIAGRRQNNPDCFTLINVRVCVCVCA